MKKVLLIPCFVIVFLTSWAQETKRYIEVRGSAESEITPDIIVLSVRLKEYEENKEKVPLGKMESDFMDAVTKSKINKERLVLSDVTLNSIQRRRRERDFYAQKTYEINFSKTEDVITFLDNLKTVKLDNLSIAKLSHTEIEKYRLETKIAALKAAEKKADALLSAVGAKLGNVLLINETPDELPILRPRDFASNAAYVMMDDDFLNESDVPLKKIKLRCEILAMFEIE